jgi:hypothetical protein
MGHLRECLHAKRVQKTNLKLNFLTNEIIILNHEKIRNEELTKMLLTVHRMVSRSSRKSTPNVEGKMRVFELNGKSVKMIW